MYNRYIAAIHNDKPRSIKFFKNFMCGDNLKPETLTSKIDPEVTLELGSFHLELYLDDRLVGYVQQKYLKTGILSCYFAYHPSLKALNLGVLSTLMEIEAIKDKAKHFPGFRYYYMGCYIHENSKLGYKANYQPVDIWCPVTDIWLPWSPQVVSRLEEKAIRLADAQDVLRVARLAPEEAKKVRNGLEGDGMLEDLVGYMAQLKSSMRLYLKLPEQMIKNAEPKLVKELEGKKYLRFEGNGSLLDVLMDTVKIHAWDLFDKLGVESLNRFDWHFD